MADPLQAFHGAKYMILTSYRKDGSGVPTTVWFGLLDGRLVMRTDSQSHKVRRMRANPAVTVAPSDARGEPRGSAVEGTAQELPAEDGRQITSLYLRRYPIGYTWEIAVLRPAHALLARLRLSRRRGKPTFFEVTLSRVLVALPALHIPELVAF